MMNTAIIYPQMNTEPGPGLITREEIATWPSEPYTIDWDSINWN